MCGLYISPSGLDHVRSVYLIPRPILHGRYISPRVPDLVNPYILPAYMYGHENETYNSVIGV